MTLLRTYLISGIVVIGLLTLLITIVVFVSRTEDHDYNEIIIQINDGRVKGNILSTRIGNEFYSFRGVRYGKPPIGDLRFKAPEPVEKWDDVFDATEDGPMCVQPFTDGSGISEDCLRLNVYTKNIPLNDKTNVKKPVIVYIPGGGLYVGSGVSTHYGGPYYLMDRDIILVTMNYRLGALGFLNLNTNEAPGNAGFKDQVLALKWIKENIDKFGGDPDNVTILGNSAGAISIVLHMVSPMSKNLFHRGILMSGALISKPLPSDQIELARRQAKLLNCVNFTSTSDIFNCLKNADATELAYTLVSLFEFGENPSVFWFPSIESDFGQERFLIEQPMDSLATENYQKIQLIVGVTKNEFGTSAVSLIKNPADLKEFDENFERVAPICFMYERDTVRSKNISAELWDAYKLTHPLSVNQINNIEKLFSDAAIGFGVNSLVNLLHQYIPIYYYHFTYEGKYSHLYYPDDKPFGVQHSDDVLYVLIRMYAPMFNVTDEENVTVERMTRMFTNFALTGNPIDATDEYTRSVKWVPYTTYRKSYLEIGNNLTLKQNLNEQRYKIWYKLFPLKRNQIKTDLPNKF